MRVILLAARSSRCSLTYCMHAFAGGNEPTDRTVSMGLNDLAPLLKLMAEQNGIAYKGR